MIFKYAVGSGGFHEGQKEGAGGPVSSFNRAAETTAAVASRKGFHSNII